MPLDVTLKTFDSGIMMQITKKSGSKTTVCCVHIFQ